jgi:HAD superfamily phosphoserine phosphatase-like hydrolase
MESDIVFLFDLDGTVTKEETLPLIAKHFKIEDEITKITEDTIRGNIPFVESFIRRVHILGALPPVEIDNLLSKIKLSSPIVEFIQNHRDNSFIVTGNLDVWVNQLIQKIGCDYYSSEGKIEENRVLKLTSILKKEEIVKQYQSQGKRVVFVGDGNNDAEAMRISDISIAFGNIHWPSNSVLQVATHAIFCEEELCRFLKQLS